VVAFARRAGSRWVVVVGTRLSVTFGLGEAPVGAAWGDTAIAWPAALAGIDAPRAFDDAISGRRLTVAGELRLADVLREFPVAALLGDANEGDERSR
jgi:maltooligosyltrehalose synthase